MITLNLSIYSLISGHFCFSGGAGDDDGGDGVDEFGEDAAAATVGGLTVVTDDLTAEQEGDMRLGGREEIGSLFGSEPELRHGDAHLDVAVVAGRELLVESLLTVLPAQDLV